MILVVDSSWFASDLLWICLWIGLIPKLQEIDSIYSLVKGIAGEILSLYHSFANGPGQDVYVWSYDNK